MKTIVHSAILLLTMTSCNVDPGPTYRPFASAYSSEEMAKQIINALQHVSSQEYVSLFPTLEDFHQMMEENSGFYGESLSAAKQEFANTYQTHLIIAAKESFDRIIREGNKKGIVWSTISFDRIELSEIIEQQFEQTQVSIVFTANGKRHKLNLEKALIMNGQWKATQFIELD